MICIAVYDWDRMTADDFMGGVSQSIVVKFTFYVRFSFWKLVLNAEASKSGGTDYDVKK